MVSCIRCSSRFGCCHSKVIHRLQLATMQGSFYKKHFSSYSWQGERILCCKAKTQIWQQPDDDSAKHYVDMIIKEYEHRFIKAVETIENGLEDSLQYYRFPEIDSRKFSSTNTLERFNKEIRRRSRVVDIFPSMDSYIRLVCCYLMEYSEDWESANCYIQKNILQAILAKRKAA